MEKPKNWDSVKANTGDYESLKLGGHEVIIKDAYEYTGMTGNTSLKIEVDINGNDDQKGFYQKQYDNNTNSNKKWPSASCKYISLKDDDTCIALYKGFTTIIENSNPGYKWNFDEKTLIGKKLCGVYGLEEFEDNEGNVKTAVKLVQLRSLDKLDKIKIPKVKLLDGTYMDYEEYIKIKHDNSLNSAKEIFGDSLTEVNDSDVPFEL
jgi:predicted secreted protein